MIIQLFSCQHLDQICSYRVFTSLITSNEKPGVKVLIEKSHSEVLKMVDDFWKSEQAKDSIDAANINLGKEFSEILSPDGYGMVN